MGDEEDRKLFVGGLPQEASQDDLQVFVFVFVSVSVSGLLNLLVICLYWFNCGTWVKIFHDDLQVLTASSLYMQVYLNDLFQCVSFLRNILVNLGSWTL